MPAGRRPKSLWLLLFFFCWVDARALGAIVFPSTSGTYHFYAALEQVWLHYLVSIVTVVLSATATNALWRPKAGWLEASLIALGVFALSGLASVWYTLRHVDLARDAYAAGRAARGLPVAPERLADIFSVPVLWSGAFGVSAGYVVLAVLAWRRRDYLPPEHDATRDDAWPV